MTRSNKVITIFVSSIAILLIVLLFVFRSKYNWMETYKSSGKEPYDTYVITQMLKNNKQKSKLHIIADASDSALEAYRGTDLNYVFIGDYYYSDSVKINSLFEFTARGNNVFISCNSVPYFLWDQLNEKCDTPLTRGIYNDSIRLGLSGNPKMTPVLLVYNDNEKKTNYNWMHFIEEGFCDADRKIKVLGQLNNNKINFVGYQYGRGQIYLHLTPIVFTNYFLVKPEIQEYASNALTYLNKGDIILDEWSKIPSYNYALDKSGSDQGPLMFILSNPSLKMGWYTTIVLLIIFLLFIGKRKQKAIPVIEKRVNTSLEYIKTIGLLYYLERSHRSASINKMKHFQLFLRNRYNIIVQQSGDEIIEKIHLVSGVNREIIRKIFEEYSFIDRTIGLSDDELISFHNHLSTFYKECK
jgi:hypothetical protein